MRGAPVEGPDEVHRLGACWAEVMNRAGRMAVAVLGPLKDACPIAIDGSAVRVGIDPEFASELEVLQEPRNRRAVEKAVSQVLNRQVTVNFEGWHPKGQPPLAVVPADTAEDEPPPAAYEVETVAAPVVEEVDSAPRATPRHVDEWKRQPEVKKVMDLFNGTIVDVRE